jgi:hypothetical protein
VASAATSCPSRASPCRPGSGRGCDRGGAARRRRSPAARGSGARPRAGCLRAASRDGLLAPWVLKSPSTGSAGPLTRSGPGSDQPRRVSASASSRSARDCAEAGSSSTQVPSRNPSCTRGATARGAGPVGTSPHRVGSRGSGTGGGTGAGAIDEGGGTGGTGAVAGGDTGAGAIDEGGGTGGTGAVAGGDTGGAVGGAGTGGTGCIGGGPGGGRDGGAAGRTGGGGTAGAGRTSDGMPVTAAPSACRPSAGLRRRNRRTLRRRRRRAGRWSRPRSTAGRAGRT